MFRKINPSNKLNIIEVKLVIGTEYTHIVSISTCESTINYVIVDPHELN